MRLRLATLLAILLGFSTSAQAADTSRGFHGYLFGTPFAKVRQSLNTSCEAKTFRTGMSVYVCTHWLNKPTILLPLCRAEKFAGVVVAVPELADPIPEYEALRKKLNQVFGDVSLENYVTHTSDDELDECPRRAVQLKRVQAGQAMLVSHWSDRHDNHVMLRTEFHGNQRFWVTLVWLASEQTLGLESPAPLIKIKV